MFTIALSYVRYCCNLNIVDIGYNLKLDLFILNILVNSAKLLTDFS